MSILGSIVVELKAQTASFIDGMNAAAKTSRSVGREIESSFSELGDVASRALAPFGVLGAAIAETLGQVGASAGSAIQSFGKLGGTLGGVTAIAGGAAAAVGALSLGSLALAASTSESIAKMGELAQASGVSVGTLSALGFAGKVVGLSMEQVTGGLEKMDKAVLKAATSPVGAASAFSRLNIALRDSTGQIKPTEEIFGELAARFSTMPDSLSKTALAMQIFGRSGAEMIPLLNRGQAGIQDLVDTATSLGVVLDDQTVQASEKFKENLGTIEAAGEGLAIQLTKDLLPALQTVTSFLVSGLKDKSSVLREMIDGVSGLTKAFLTVGEVIYKVLEQIGVFVGNSIAALTELGVASYNAVASAAHFDWSGVVSAWQEGNRRIAAVNAQGAADSKRVWEEAGAFIRGVWSPLAAATPTHRTGATPDTSAKADPALEAIRARIAALAIEAEGWLRIANAGTQAEQLIAEAVKKGNDEFNKLKQEAAKDKNNPTGALSLVQKNESLIKGAEAAAVYGAAIKSLNSDLDKQANKFEENDRATLALAAAYQQGGAAIASAAISAQFADQIAKIDVLTAAYSRLALEPTKNAASMKQLADAIAAETAKLQANESAASKLASDELSTALNKQQSLFTALAPQVASLNNAYLKGADAVRAARIELELYQFVQEELSKGIVVTPAQQKQKKTELTAQDTQSYDATVKQAAAQYDLNALYADGIKKLADVRKAIQDAGDSTLLIDAKMFESENALIHQWDDAALKVGTFGQRFQSAMNEISLQGRQAGAEITKAFETAIDGVETQLAKLMTGQKANFKQVFQGLAESVAKSEIQRTFGSIADAFTGKKSSTPIGTRGNPMYVTFDGGFARALGASSAPGALGAGTDGASGNGILGKLSSALGLNRFAGGGGGASGGKSGGAGGIGGFLSKVFGLAGGGLDKLLTGQISNLLLSSQAAAAQTALGGAGALAGGGAGAGIGLGEDAAADMSSLFSTFGGFMAAGGDVSPGKTYVVGEKHAEIFQPRTAGRITPELPNKQPARMTNITNNFNFPEKPDLMKKSQNQLNREQYRQMSLAHSRG